MRFNRLSAGLALLGLLGVVSALGTATYNYLNYQILLTRSENLRIEREQSEKNLDILPLFEKMELETTDYKKPIVKAAGTQPERPARKAVPQKAPAYNLMMCWKCKKPFRIREGIKKGKCPHCGTGWALK